MTMNIQKHLKLKKYVLELWPITYGDFHKGFSVGTVQLKYLVDQTWIRSFKIIFWSLEYLILSEIHFGQVKKKQEPKSSSQNENSKKTKQSRINARRRESIEAKVVFLAENLSLRLNE